MPKPKMIGEGTNCTWWGAEAEARRDTIGRPRCPHCAGPVVVITADERAARFRSDKIPGLASAMADLAATFVWQHDQHGHCFPTVEAMIDAHDAVMDLRHAADPESQEHH